MNTFGHIFRLTSFGESHGNAIGGIIDGCPPGISVDLDFIQYELNRRKPGQSNITTSRNENDVVEFLSGLFEGKTTGTPIGFIVRNTNQHSADYNNLKNIYRPSHADYTYDQKYGVRDYRGGGRSSARETIARVVAGGLAKLVLRESGISINAYTSQVGSIKIDETAKIDFDTIEKNPVRCPDSQKAREMETLIREVKDLGDTIGGVISCICTGVPVGLGEPVFEKLQASLASAMLSINAAKGFEYGMGFEGVRYRGSEVNDLFVQNADGKIRTLSNHSGGIQGGISNGEPIYFRVAFKPVATLLQEQKTVDRDGNETVINAKGRHDPCVLPRAVPIVEAMTAISLLDHYLMYKASR